jgi:hypothetical protein
VTTIRPSCGSFTHGLLAPSAVVDHSDVAELVGAGWVGPDLLDQLPKVTGQPGSVVYAPLQDTPVEPDVVLLKLIPIALVNILATGVLKVAFS